MPPSPSVGTERPPQAPAALRALARRTVGGRHSAGSAGSAGRMAQEGLGGMAPPPGPPAGQALPPRSVACGASQPMAASGSESVVGR